MQVKFKNVWGSAGSNLDQQRSDLFAVTLRFPSILNVGGDVVGGGSNLWDSECSFAVSQFPFPDRIRETIPIKYLQQVNHTIGADAPSGPIDIQVRYAFNRRTAELLERWHWLTSNPITGGVALTSAIKSSGVFHWLVPNMDKQANVEDTTEADVMWRMQPYFLEGVIVRNFKPAETANMETAGVVNLTFSISIDRYYPRQPSDLTFQSVQGLFGSGGLSL